MCVSTLHIFTLYSHIRTMLAICHLGMRRFSIQLRKNIAKIFPKNRHTHTHMRLTWAVLCNICINNKKETIGPEKLFCFIERSVHGVYYTQHVPCHRHILRDIMKPLRANRSKRKNLLIWKCCNRKSLVPGPYMPRFYKHSMFIILYKYLLYIWAKLCLHAESLVWIVE